MDNHLSGHPLQHKIAAPVLFHAENVYPTVSEQCDATNNLQLSNGVKSAEDNCMLPHLSLQRSVLGEGQPPTKQTIGNCKGPQDLAACIKQENNLTQCAHARREAPNTLFIHRPRKPGQDSDASFEQNPFLSPQSKLRAQQRSLLPQLSSCIFGSSNTDLDDFSPYLGSGISEVPSFPSLLSPHSSTHHLSRKRALSSSPHSDLLSDLYRSSPTAAVFPMPPNGPQVEPIPGAAGHYRLQKQKTSIEQNQNLDGSMDTTITKKITFTEHRQRSLLRYSYPGNEQPSNLAVHQVAAAQPIEYYDHLSPRSNCSMTSHSTSTHSNQPRDDMEPYVCLWEDCNQMCDEQEDLVQHIESRHVEKGKSEDFTCMWKACIRKKKPFNARYKLLIHMRIHSGEKPNKCTVSPLCTYQCQSPLPPLRGIVGA